MTTKRRTDYQVDEEALKRMMAGDVTALERTVPPEERFVQTANKKNTGCSG